MDFSHWTKISHLSLPHDTLTWSKSYMQTPVPYFYEGKLFVFYGTRNKENISSISWVELDYKNNFKIINSPKKPLLSKGSIGNFDDSGVIPSSIIKIKNKTLLYYMGWSKGGNVVTNNAGGVAEINFKNMTSKKIFNGPILDRSKEEPYYCAVPRVYKINSKYFMYYLGVNEWLGKEQSKDAVYEMRIATSNDGINWNRNNSKAIPLKNTEGGQYPFSIIKNEKKFYGFYSSRKKFDYRSNEKNAYKIYLAESSNGLDWKNSKRITLNGNLKNKDTIMQAYPSVIKLQKDFILFYNGNNFGKHGIEIAYLN